MARNQTGKTVQKRKKKKTDAEKAREVKTSLILDIDTDTLLGAASLWTKKNKSALISELIVTHLGDYAVTFKGRKTADPVVIPASVVSASLEHDVNLSVQAGQ